ncbi:MAG: hypothetical protein RMZ95_026110 [Nostoc sp. DedQUE07]
MQSLIELVYISGDFLYPLIRAIATNGYHWRLLRDFSLSTKVY